MDSKTIIDKYSKDEKIQNIVKLYKKLYGWGIFLIIVGCLGVATCFSLVIYVGIKQSSGFRGRDAGPFIWNLIGIAIFACVISAGVYIFKSSKIIKNGLIVKLNEMENNKWKKLVKNKKY